MTPPPFPPRKHGLAHLLAATRYSVQGVRRLWHEPAFRHELLAASLLLPGLWVLGVPVWALAVQLVLLLILIAVEAFNTAIEVLVDHMTREWAPFAAQAKDLGSLAVACLLLANGVWVMVGLWLAFGV